MNLIFLEEIEQIDSVAGLLKAGYRAVAFTPKVVHELEKKGIAYLRPEDYYDNDALQREWTGYYDLSWKIIRSLDDELLSKTDDFDLSKLKIRPLEANAQMFFNMFRQIVINIYILEKIFEKESPKKVIYPEEIPDKLTYRLYFEDESVVSYLVPIFAKIKGFEEGSFSWQKTVVLPGIKRSELPSIRKFIRESLLRVAGHFKHNPNKRSILVFHNGYDLNYIIPLLLKKGHKVIDFEAFLKNTKKVSERAYYHLVFSKDNNYESLFEYRSVNFFPLVKTRLAFYLDNVLPGYISLKHDLEKLLKRSDILIGGHSPSRVYENILCALAKDRGIKVVSFQHGGYGERFNHILHVNDFDNPLCDYFLSWGEGVKRYAVKYNLNRIKIIPVGSAWLDSLAIKNHHEGSADDSIKTILYIPTSLRVKPRSRMLPGEYSDNTYYDLQKKIISSVAKDPNVKLLVKLHPGDEAVNPIIDFIKEANLNNCSIVYGELSRWFEGSDLVISDFMSTTLLVALSMKKNVFFYIDSTAMLLERDARAMIDKAAYTFTSINDFLGSISDYVDSPGKFPRKTGDEFIINYGTYMNDGQSGKRAVEAIEKIFPGASLN